MSMFGVPVFIRAAIFILFSFIFPLIFLFCFVFVFSDSFHLKKYFVKNENCGLQSVCSTPLSSCSYFSPTLSFSQLVSTGWWLKGGWEVGVGCHTLTSPLQCCFMFPDFAEGFPLKWYLSSGFLKTKKQKPQTFCNLTPPLLKCQFYLGECCVSFCLSLDALAVFRPRAFVKCMIT